MADRIATAYGHYLPNITAISGSTSAENGPMLPWNYFKSLWGRDTA